MMTKDKALKMAIDKWANNFTHERHQNNAETKFWLAQYKMAFNDLFNTCKEALEQPVLAPVAWMHRHAGEITEFNDFQSCEYCEPLYTHPHQWQGLTDDEIVKELERTDEYMGKSFFAGVRWAEQALKDKND